MVDWLAGKRVRGTSSERSGFGTSLGGTGVGGWVELGRTTLSGTADTISVGSLSDKRYYMVLVDQRASGDTNHGFRLNGDTGNNYSQRAKPDGGTEYTQTSSSYLMANWGSAVSTNAFHVGYIANYSSKEKLAIIHNVQQKTAGASTAPSRQEGVGKHAQTSNPINAVSLTNSDTGDYVSGSEVVVLGWDPADSHSNNFWQELASVEWTSGNTMSTGTIPAKKYLWIQGYFKSATVDFVKMIFNDDTGANYSYRYNANGGTDGTSGSLTRGAFTISGVHSPAFTNHFFINNANNEKLGISHVVHRNNTGAGNAPERIEQVDKWSNTSNQITKIDAIMNTGNFSAGYLRVWGAD